MVLRFPCWSALACLFLLMPVSGHTPFLWGPPHATQLPGDAEKPDQGGPALPAQLSKASTLVKIRKEGICGCVSARLAKTSSLPRYRKRRRLQPGCNSELQTDATIRPPLLGTSTSDSFHPLYFLWGTASPNVAR